ncbi:TetR/AcrR family transcriptional regulator [Alcanivorax sp. S6407]|uniref:TetR/AcrR family transcriptional regulator n=1 Tax=Alcanivorax sp. S6407 TaxID=2926424 RepID=UPI001FF4F6C4|nr:TetR/AcrR family transcriptional regulator [Alcanivorax sp. S6407]MCK0153775.1 TetR/AcrR family transcriptional regulator [Alcanivorax sp. S6407]
MISNPSKPTRRGRPPRSQKQAADSRERIINAARTLFAEEGYHGVSMRKIAALADCSPAALYKLFPGKRQLLLHIWGEIFAELIAGLQHCADSTEPADRLEAMCLTYLDFWLSRPDDYRAIFLIEDQPQSEDESYFVDSSGIQEGFQVLRQAVVDAQALGVLGDGDPDEKQSVLMCGMQGVAMNLITIPEYPWGDPEMIKRATVRALIAGL